ncbi:MAG: LiaI-LiaF-like domain-containing protein [Bacillota bacterium]
MKKISLLPGIILLGIGLFYSIQKLNIHLFENQNSWQALLILLGAAYLISGHFEKDNSAILPGIILAGLGIHFVYQTKIPSWPDHPAAFLFILAFGMLLTAIKTKSGHAQGLLLLAIGLFLHFFQTIIQSLTIVENGIHLIETYWPFLLILTGAFLVFIKRKK